MLVITTTVGVLHGVHGHTTHVGPAVTLDLVPERKLVALVGVVREMCLLFNASTLYTGKHVNEFAILRFVESRE